MKRERLSTTFIEHSHGLGVDRAFLGDAQVRNDFNKPHGKSCDGVLHLDHCPYVLMEEKSASQIDKAIAKFEEMDYHLHQQNKKVVKCVIYYLTLRKYQNIFEVKKGYLINKLTGNQVLINHRVPVEMVKRSKKTKGV